MRALTVFFQQREVRLIDAEEPPPPGEGEVLLQMREVGVCGTDREIARFGYGRPPPGCDHLILGHEALASVLEVGPGVERCRPGDWVVPTVRRPCPHPHCRACRVGRQDFCTTGDFRERGIKEAHGFVAERVLERCENVLPIPSTLSEVGVLTEPLSVVSKGSLQLTPIRERLPWEPLNQRAVVLGAGPVGLLAAMMLVVHGYETTVYSRQPPEGERARLVASFGARYLSSQECAARQLGNRLGQLDLIFEAAGAPQLAFEALESLGANGSFIFTGVPAEAPMSQVDTPRLMRNIVLQNQLIFGTVNASRGAVTSAIRYLEMFMHLFPKSVERLFSRRVPLEASPELLRDRWGIKDVITFP